MLIEDQARDVQEVDLSAEPSPEEITDDVAVELVKRDAEIAENWIRQFQWNERWEEIDILYDSPRVFKTWEQNTVMQPNVQRYIISRHVNSIHPAMQEGLFQESPPFFALPKPSTTNDTVRARTTVIGYQLEEMDFETEVSNGLFQTILHGTGIWKWGMRWEEEEIFQYSSKQQPIDSTGSLGQPISINTEQSDLYDEDIKKKWVLKPFLENRELRSVLVDSSLRLPDIRKAKFVIDKDFVTLADLLDMKAQCDQQIEAGEEPEWDLPGETTIRDWFEPPKEDADPSAGDDTIGTIPTVAGQGESEADKTTEDPSLQGLPILERWDKYKVITTLNNKWCLKNKKNPYGILPFYSCNWYNRIRAFYGLGVGKIIAQDQRLSQGVTNGGLALLQLLLDPPFAVDEDSNVSTQNVRFRKGGFIKVKTKSGNVRDGIVPLEMPRMPVAEIMTFLQNSENESEAADGANALTMQGSVPGSGGKSSITRTGTGVNAFQGAVASRLQGPLDRFINQVFIPWIYQLDKLNTRFLPMSQVREILGEELGPQFSVDPMQFKTGKMIFTALAGTRMAAKRVMAASLPVLTSLLLNPTVNQQLEVQDSYLDILEFLKTWMQATGWPVSASGSLIKKMSAQMKQNLAASKPEVQKAQADAANQDKKQQGAEQLQQGKIVGGIARDAVKSALTHGQNALTDALDKGVGEIARGDVVGQSRED